MVIVVAVVVEGGNHLGVKVVMLWVHDESSVSCHLFFWGSVVVVVVFSSWRQTTLKISTPVQGVVIERYKKGNKDKGGSNQAFMYSKSTGTVTRGAT